MSRSPSPEPRPKKVRTHHTHPLPPTDSYHRSPRSSAESSSKATATTLSKRSKNPRGSLYQTNTAYTYGTHPLSLPHVFLPYLHRRLIPPSRAGSHQHSPPSSLPSTPRSRRHYRIQQRVSRLGQCTLTDGRLGRTTVIVRIRRGRGRVVSWGGLMRGIW